ncbi:hypothetical protein FQN52_008334 [Onygenales sp. PD_12]|nr:hypothetical protein FQN52_008334 [Onygenales sp. PD_12]KAK2787070.1 hypothetical protein FQN53_005770 [Emmonsiellopsis sp. PD_33]KAK2799155.1 hypothetical protein FQN51_007124 [Onygenales sp. PD_10]
MASQQEIRLRALESESLSILDSIDSSTSKHQVDHHTNRARRVVQTMNSIPVTQEPTTFQLQLRILKTLQRVAYHDPDSGGVKDIAQWCVHRWLILLQLQPENWEVSKGLGHAWLLKSQQFLSQIHENDHGPASGKGKARSHSPNDKNSLHSPNYVEARATLVPATEYFSRAVNVAESKGQATGELLILAAEAFMSLGNVSYPQNSEGSFIQAVLYLRKAAKIPGYRLPSHLRQYLQEYGAFVQ